MRFPRLLLLALSGLLALCLLLRLPASSLATTAPWMLLLPAVALEVSVRAPPAPP